MTLTTNAAPHLFWITSRAAGIVALVLASLGVSLGLLMATKLLRRRGPDLIALHEILSLTTLVAIAVHGLALLGDQFMHPSLADIAVPFVSGYKTFWTSAGIIAGWAMVLLGLSYYARRRIGAVRWRKLHRFTLIAWLAGLAHALGEGTDAGQIWFLAMIGLVVIPAAALALVRHLSDERPNARSVAAAAGDRRPAASVPAASGTRASRSGASRSGASSPAGSSPAPPAHRRPQPRPLASPGPLGGD